MPLHTLHPTRFNLRLVCLFYPLSWPAPQSHVQGEMSCSSAPAVVCATDMCIYLYARMCTSVWVGVCVCERAPSLAFCTQHSPLASCTARPELYLFLMPFAFANSFHKCCCCCCSYCCCCESCDCNTFCGRIKQKSSRRQQQQAANRKRNTTKTTTTMATLATLAMMMEMAQRGSGSGRETGIIPTRELKLPSLLICTNSRESERKKIQ